MTVKEKEGERVIRFSVHSCQPFLKMSLKICNIGAVALDD